jgi:hypothetical protein
MGAPLDDLAIETYRCELLIREIVYRADLGDRASVAELFVDDGVYAFGPGNLRLEGRDAIRAWFTETSSPRRPLARHICTNTTVRFRDATHAEATTYLTLVRLVDTAQIPATIKGVDAIGVYHDELIKVDDTWLLRSRRYEPTFRVEPSGR